MHSSILKQATGSTPSIPLKETHPTTFRTKCRFAKLVPLLFIIFLGAVLRLVFFDFRGLWYDEGSTLLLSEYVSNFFPLFNTDYNTDPPLFLIIIYVWRRVIAALGLTLTYFWQDQLLRIVPLFFSVLAIPAVYFATHSILTNLERTDSSETTRDSLALAEHASLLAALLIAISPLQLYYSHELRNYSLFTLFAAIILWAFSNAIRYNRPFSWALVALFLTLGFWNHFFAAWFFIVLDIFLILTWRSYKHVLKPWLLWHCIAGLACLPPLYLAYHTALIINNIKIAWTPPPDLKTPFITFKALFTGYGPTVWAYWAIFLLAGFLCCLSLWSLRRQQKTLLLLLLWTALPIVVCTIIWRLRSFSYYEIRLFIGSSISAAILAGIGLASLPKLVQRTILLLLIVFTVPLIGDTYAHRIHPVPTHRLGVRYKPENRAAAEYIASHSPPTDPVFHASHVTLTAFKTYLPNRIQKHVCAAEHYVQGFIDAYPSPRLWQNLGLIPVPADTLEFNTNTFWLVISWWEPFEIHPMVYELESWFHERFIEIDRKEFFALTLIRFQKP